MKNKFKMNLQRHAEKGINVIESKAMRELKNQLSIKQVEIQNLINQDNVTDDEMNNLQAEIKTIMNKITMQEELEKLENSITEPQASPQKPLEPENTVTPVNAFVDVMKYEAGINETVSNEVKKVVNATTMTEGVPEDGGLTVPQDIRTAIIELRRSYPDSLENYVNVERVATLTGSRVIEKEADFVPFDNIDEAAEFPEFDGPQFEQIKYEVKKKGGILKFSRELLEDTAENIIAYVKKWTGKKGKATRNALILKKLNEDFGTKKTLVKSLDDLKDIYNVELDPAISLTSIAITNQDGFNTLDKLKDTDGKYVLQPNPVNATQRLLFGKYPIVVTHNKTMPTVKNKAPIWCGDLKEAITIFDREALYLEFNDKGDDAWKKDLMAMKARERLDIKTVDNKAVVGAEIDINSMLEPEVTELEPEVTE